jgi:ParB-like chromosome segregation protein Spo0J
MPPQLPLAIVSRPISDLVNSPRNSRTHTPRQIRQLTKSIETFGFTNPALLAPDGTIIDGHGRVAGAKLLGMVERKQIFLNSSGV